MFSVYDYLSSVISFWNQFVLCISAFRKNIQKSKNKYTLLIYAKKKKNCRKVTLLSVFYIFHRPTIAIWKLFLYQILCSHEWYFVNSLHRERNAFLRYIHSIISRYISLGKFCYFDQKVQDIAYFFTFFSTYNTLHVQLLCI